MNGSLEKKTCEEDDDDENGSLQKKTRGKSKIQHAVECTECSFSPSAIPLVIFFIANDATFVNPWFCRFRCNPPYFAAFYCVLLHSTAFITTMDLISNCPCVDVVLCLPHCIASPCFNVSSDLGTNLLAPSDLDA